VDGRIFGDTLCRRFWTSSVSTTVQKRQFIATVVFVAGLLVSASVLSWSSSAASGEASRGECDCERDSLLSERLALPTSDTPHALCQHVWLPPSTLDTHRLCRSDLHRAPRRFIDLGPFYGAIAVASVTRCRCCRGHRCAGGVRQ